MRGFTLLEVMVSLAIMAGVILTVVGSVNYHLLVISRERDDTTLTLLARSKLMELSQAGIGSGQGTFAPMRSDISWKAEQRDTELPVLKKLILTVHRTGDKREVTLVRYLSP